MKIDKIITLANDNVKLQFLGMERSLRAVGCNLPIFVIPYDSNLFDLPANSTWWKDGGFCSWIDSVGSRPVMRKYQALLASSYLFVDTDVVFLKSPEELLDAVDGFITSCCHWHNPGHTYTNQSVDYLAEKTTTWQKSIFNSGQFACSQQLYTLQSLKQLAHSEWACETILNHPYHEQPGMNLLVNSTSIPIINLTLPPYLMESTWAGDYEHDYERYWVDDARKPFLIHWAGRKMNGQMPIDKLFFQYMSPNEKDAYIGDQAIRSSSDKGYYVARKVLRAAKSFFKVLASN